MYQRTRMNDRAKASSPCVRAGRQSLGFYIRFSPHFVPTGAERTRPSMERHEVGGRQIKEMEHFHTDGLDLLWGKGWQSLEKSLRLKCCQSCLCLPPSSVCSVKLQLFPDSIYNHCAHLTNYENSPLKKQNKLKLFWQHLSLVLTRRNSFMCCSIFLVRKVNMAPLRWLIAVAKQWMLLLCPEHIKTQ